jgi:hypothetical protein
MICVDMINHKTLVSTLANVKQKIGGKGVERKSWALPKATECVRNVGYNTTPLHLNCHTIM